MTNTLLGDRDAGGTVNAGDGPATWVIRDGKRVAKFQYVGTGGSRGYFTIVPVDKNSARPRTEYLTDGPTPVASSSISSTCLYIGCLARTPTFRSQPAKT